MSDTDLIEKAEEVITEACATEEPLPVTEEEPTCNGQCHSCHQHEEEESSEPKNYPVNKTVIDKMNSLMAKADKGAKLCRKDMMFVIRTLHGVCQLHEHMLHGILNDLVTLAREIGTTDHGVFDLSTTFAAVHMLLRNKGVITDEEVASCWKEVMAQAKKELEEAKAEQEAQEKQEASRIIVPGK